MVIAQLLSGLRALVLATIVLLAVAPASASADDPAASFYGIYTEAAHLTPQYRDDLLDQYSQVGVGLLREPFDWARVEQTPGQIDRTFYDGFVASATQRSMAVMPTLLGAPAWENAAPARGGDARGLYPPRDPGKFAAFARAMVERYGRGGSFWADHPELPYRPITAWQVWNEPNVPYFWPTGPDPAQYAELLIATSAGIKAADPAAEVVTAGLPDSTLGTDLYDYLRGLYLAGADRSWDTLAVHPYAADAGATISIVEYVRSIQRHYGDRAPLRVTEFGWATAGRRAPWTTTEAGQAQRVAASMAELTDRRVELGVRGLVYFGWQDGPVASAANSQWMGWTGFVRADKSRKPAWYAYRDAARRLSAGAAAGAQEPNASPGGALASPDSQNAGGAGRGATLAVSFVLRPVVGRDGTAYARVRCRAARAERCRGRLTLRLKRGRRRCREGLSRSTAFVGDPARSVALWIPLGARASACLPRRGSTVVRVNLSARSSGGGRFERSKEALLALRAR